ncbi:hypothetical protein DFJ74DRAFT_505989 [Hyaloraphidium curvatum]|nr:hypothetical protein DFJ74DRAFT_505989 [Hyaloraphidium curvatum]
MSSRRRLREPPPFFSPNRSALLVDAKRKRYVESVPGWPDEKVSATSKRLIVCDEEGLPLTASDPRTPDTGGGLEPLTPPPSMEIEFVGRGKRAAPGSHQLKFNPSLANAKGQCCKVCSNRLQHVRFYCTYCTDEPYSLCMQCYSARFPFHHEHTMSAFAREFLLRSVKALATCSLFPCVPDFLTLNTDVESLLYTDIDAVSPTPDGVSGPLRPRRRGMKKKIQPKPDVRRICAFCNDDKEDDGMEAGSSGPFIGSGPDVGFLLSLDAEGKKVVKFFAHENCAKFNPDVFKFGPQWVNVAHVLKHRARKIKCAKCQYRGASVGCFAPECRWSFHVRCTGQKPAEFLSGKVFWCAKHDPRLFGFQESYSCDGCGTAFGQNDTWFTCASCRDHHAFSTVDCCKDCFGAKQSASGAPDVQHVVQHKDERWVLTSFQSAQDDASSSMVDVRAERNKLMGIRAKVPGPRKRPRNAQTSCFYCWGDEIFDASLAIPGELPTCRECYGKAGICTGALEASMDAAVGTLQQEMDTVRSLLHSTRSGNILGAPGATASDTSPSARTSMLKSYAPADDQLYSLFYDSTFYDIEDRAPRWASHSGAYHGQWLPQVPRASLLRYTKPDDLVLSNFLGQGTDAVESFLLRRKLVGIDINPSAVLLSRRNLHFALPAGSHGITPAHRPKLVVGDARFLGAVPQVEEGAFDHVLCHPPYKNAIRYTDDVPGDLSHISSPVLFCEALQAVAREAYRLLRPWRRATLCMGDNRRNRIYQPITFDLVRAFLDAGFEVEELIVKGQRFMEHSPLGKVLSSTFGFQFFNHELVAIVRKVPAGEHHRFDLPSDVQELISRVPRTICVKRLPFLLRDRGSGARGTLWEIPSFDGIASFEELSVSRILERFGRNEQLCEVHDLSAFGTAIALRSFKDARVCSFPATMGLPALAVEEKSDEPEPREELSEYEQARFAKVAANRLKMKEFGLLPIPDPEPGSHLDLWRKAPTVQVPQAAKLDLILVPPLAFGPEAILPAGDWIQAYRGVVSDAARSAVSRLKDGGFLIVGVRDVRVDRTVCPTMDELRSAPEGRGEPAAAEPGTRTRLIPLTMLVLEDIKRSCAQTTKPESLRLRELTVCVPANHSKKKTADIDGLRELHAAMERSWLDETRAEEAAPDAFAPRAMLPIVHTFWYMLQFNAGVDDTEESAMDCEFAETET